jgi:hypothetical protein
VILQPWQTGRAAQLHAANPRVRVLAYKNLTMISRKGRAPTSATGTWSERARAAWYLHSARTGARLRSRGWSYRYLADPGDPAYRRRWIANVIPQVKRGGFDGVFLDDVNATTEGHWPQADVREYPSAFSYQVVTRGMLARVSEALHANGLLAVTNFGAFGAGGPYDAIYLDWLRHADGAILEHFVKWGGTGSSSTSGYVPEPVWEAQLQRVKDVEARGKSLLLFTAAPNGARRAGRYGYATALLGGAGRTFFDQGTTRSESSYREYEYRLGSPLGPETRDPVGVHRRYFRCGLALVNPTAARQLVAFGAPYSGSGLRHATSASMGANTGLILYKPGCA